MSAGDPVTALICEDEPLARRAIREYLADVDWIEVVGQAENGREAMRLLHKLEPDLVFMDVRMPGLTGLEVLDAATHVPAVVFTTAFDEYAVTAFELGAVDYLVKPFGRDRLLETLQRVRVRLIGEGRAGWRGAPDRAADTGVADRVFARRKGSIVPVAVHDIVRAEATDGGTRVTVAGGELTYDGTLTELHDRLDPRTFVRVHRAHLVNLDRVSGIDRYDERRLRLRLSDGASIVASRAGSRLLRDLMG